MNDQQHNDQDAAGLTGFVEQIEQAGKIDEPDAEMWTRPAGMDPAYRQAGADM